MPPSWKKSLTCLYDTSTTLHGNNLFTHLHLTPDWAIWVQTFCLMPSASSRGNITCSISRASNGRGSINAKHIQKGMLQISSETNSISPICTYNIIEGCISKHRKLPKQRVPSKHLILKDMKAGRNSEIKMNRNYRRKQVSIMCMWWETRIFSIRAKRYK